MYKVCAKAREEAWGRAVVVLRMRMVWELRMSDVKSGLSPRPPHTDVLCKQSARHVTRQTNAMRESKVVLWNE